MLGITYDPSADYSLIVVDTRALIQQEYGANQHYTGNGSTKNLLPGRNDCGVMEVLNVDKNPELIGNLIENKVAKRLPCTSIQGF